MAPGSHIGPSTLEFVQSSTLRHGMPGSSESRRSSWISSFLPSSRRTSTSTAHRLTAVPPGEVEGVEEETNPELRLPSIKTLIIVLGGNALFQLSFFIIIPSASTYAEYLGGTPTFSGLIIGIPTIFSGIMLLLVKRFDGGQYRRPFTIAYISALLGNIVYALAYLSNFLYLLLIARMIVGISFTSFMFSRKYCTDPRLVGIRRRTTIAGWYVVGQAFGFSAGPWIGGMLYQVGFGNPGFNGYTAPGWVVAGIWLVFWIVSGWLFEDVPRSTRETRPAIGEIEMNVLSAASRQENEQPPSLFSLTLPQMQVLVCMCYYSTVFFFILAAWESNIPIFTASALGYSPYQAGNFIALGGAATFPFLFLNVRYAYRIQDRVILATGTSLGLLGVILFLCILLTNTVRFGSLFAAWFLVALGFNLASTCTLSLLSKQLPNAWNTKASMAIQYSNYIGRVAGAVMGGAGVKMGMARYAGIQAGVVGLGVIIHFVLWRELKAKAG